MRQTTRRAKSSNLPIFQSSNLPAGSLSHGRLCSTAKSSGRFPSRYRLPPLGGSHRPKSFFLFFSFFFPPLPTPPGGVGVLVEVQAGLSRASLKKKHTGAKKICYPPCTDIRPLFFMGKYFPCILGKTSRGCRSGVKKGCRSGVKKGCRSIFRKIVQHLVHFSV
jgi:hypothetical protein